MKRTALIILALATAGCVTYVRPLTPDGGSRSDAVVRMAARHAALSGLMVDVPSTTVAAIEACRAWGFDDAQPFGTIREDCTHRGMTGECVWKTASMNYQCLSRPTSQR